MNAAPLQTPRVAMVLALVAGCSGALQQPLGPGKSGDGGAAPGDITPGECASSGLEPQPLRRLSERQYHNTLRDLFGPDLSPQLREGSLFPPTLIENGFSGDAEANVVNTAESEAIEDEAERIAALVMADPERFLHGLLPCAPAAGAPDAEVDACIDDFIAEFGERAYRRPLSAEETTIAQGLYDAVRGDQGARTAFATLLQLFVQSPALLYRVERGVGVEAQGLVRLSDFEMASRLSYFLTDTMPDVTLFEAARAGQLRGRDAILAQAERLMQTKAFERVAQDFHREWLHVYDLSSAAKDPTAFPEFDAGVRSALEAELSGLVSFVLEQRDGSLRDLLTTTEFPVSAELAPLYGVTASASGEAVSVPQRRGVLTTASFMAALSSANSTNPIHRGAFFMREVLCRTLPVLPGSVDTVTALTSTADRPTARERYAPLLENPACSGCHTLFNPVGLAFERYDGIGRFREQENGVPIDASGRLTIDSVPHEFDSAIELVQQVADADEIYGCYAQKLTRAALGRPLLADDACAVANLSELAADGGGDLRELVVAIVGSDAFLFRAQETE